MGMGNVQQCAVAVSGRPYTPLTLVVPEPDVPLPCVILPCRARAVRARAAAVSGRVGLLSSPLLSLTVTVLSSVVGGPSQSTKGQGLAPNPKL